jgi:hypothetical protein
MDADDVMSNSFIRVKCSFSARHQSMSGTFLLHKAECGRRNCVIPQDLKQYFIACYSILCCLIKSEINVTYCSESGKLRAIKVCGNGSIPTDASNIHHHQRQGLVLLDCSSYKVGLRIRPSIAYMVYLFLYCLPVYIGYR